MLIYPFFYEVSQKYWIKGIFIVLFYTLVEIQLISEKLGGKE